MIQQQVLENCCPNLLQATGPQNLLAGVVVCNVELVGDHLLILRFFDLGSSDVETQILECSCLHQPTSRFQSQLGGMYA